MKLPLDEIKNTKYFFKSRSNLKCMYIICNNGNLGFVGCHRTFFTSILDNKICTSSINSKLSNFKSWYIPNTKLFQSTLSGWCAAETSTSVQTASLVLAYQRRRLRRVRDDGRCDRRGSLTHRHTQVTSHHTWHHSPGDDASRYRRWRRRDSSVESARLRRAIIAHGTAQYSTYSSPSL